MADACVVGDGARAADSRLTELLLLELTESVGLGADTAQEGATVLTQFSLLEFPRPNRGQWYDIYRVRPAATRVFGLESATARKAVRQSAATIWNIGPMPNAVATTPPRTGPTIPPMSSPEL